MMKVKLTAEMVKQSKAQPRALKDQQPIEAIVAIAVPARGEERVNVTTDGGRCWAFWVEKSIFDTTFTIHTFDGEPLRWDIYQAHSALDNFKVPPESPNGQEMLVRSDQLH
jgi:hypothetical protein